MYRKLRNLSAIALGVVGTAYGQLSPAGIVNEPAPIGMSASGATVLFSQPYCDYQTDPRNTSHPIVTRGVYVMGSSTPLATIPTPSPCTENYFSVSLGLGGFPAGSIYVAAVRPSDNKPVIYQYPSSGGAAPASTFAVLSVEASSVPHASLMFDSIGTFGFNLIATGSLGIQGYNSNGGTTFTYPNPASGFFLEWSTVAPLGFAPCPGCLLIAATNITSKTAPGAIYAIRPGTPSGTVPSFFATGPTEPEAIFFVTAPFNCTNTNGFSYFVAGFNTPNLGTNPDLSNGGAILEYTPAQLSAFQGTFLVPDEITGTIYAYRGPDFSPGTPNRTVFSNTAYQLEGSTVAQCGGAGPGGGPGGGPGPVPGATGFMTGGGQLAKFAASHGFNLGCTLPTNHDNLEVNWPATSKGTGDNHFHLESITSVSCYMDPSLNPSSPNPPPADFNTLVLTGTGKFNNQSGATISLIFTDQGEPGVNDQAAMRITFQGSTVLNVPFAPIANGNQQAHK